MFNEVIYGYKMRTVQVYENRETALIWIDNVKNGHNLCFIEDETN